MFRKLRSDRDPRDTVFSELKKEFSVYFHQAGESFRKMVVRYPKVCFWIMVACMLISMVLSFTILGTKAPAHKPLIGVRGRLAPVGDGLSKLYETGAALRQSIRLKRRVDSLSAKATLTARDSLTLENALDELRQINQQLNY